ncbi:MAG: NEAT domain-containing protein [Clostridiales Family XIII bacterium]|jgi:hypothetical protein|nr:NEAT domain-containing protein [Clostridiales Family XIII bacterium]
MTMGKNERRGAAAHTAAEAVPARGYASRKNRLAPRAAALCAVLLFALLAAAPLFGTAFATDDGVYLAATNTYYLNPDTGVTDDGGSKNAAIGEGMCRSVIYEKALVEAEDGKLYVTVRVQLVSNMGAIKFTVQQKAGDTASYAAVSPRIVAEDAGADTADYRFSVPAVNSYIGCSTYVTPMGRDVKFYMNLSSDLTAGSGDFVVSVKPKATQAADPAPAAETDTAQTDPAKTPAEAEIVPAAPAPPDTGAEENAATENAQGETAAQAETTGADGAAAASETDGAAEGERTGAETAAVADGPAAESAGTAEAEAGGAGTEATNADEDAAAQAGASAETEAGGGFPVLPAVVVAILVIVGVAISLISLKRRK